MNVQYKIRPYHLIVRQGKRLYVRIGFVSAHSPTVAGIRPERAGEDPRGGPRALRRLRVRGLAAHRRPGRRGLPGAGRPPLRVQGRAPRRRRRVGAEALPRAVRGAAQDPPGGPARPGHVGRDLRRDRRQPGDPRLPAPLPARRDPGRHHDPGRAGRLGRERARPAGAGRGPAARLRSRVAPLPGAVGDPRAPAHGTGDAAPPRGARLLPGRGAAADRRQPGLRRPRDLLPAVALGPATGRIPRPAEARLPYSQGEPDSGATWEGTTCLCTTTSPASPPWSSTRSTRAGRPAPACPSSGSPGSRWTPRSRTRSSTTR